MAAVLMADRVWGLEKNCMTAHGGGGRPGAGTLHKDPMTKREIGGKPAGKFLFITNGRNLEMPTH